SLTEFVKATVSNEQLASCLKWFEDKPTLFHLMDRKTGKVRYTFQSEAFFYLHIINQYEEDNHVVIDICCYKDPEMINCMYLESIVNMQSNPNYASHFRGRPLRFVLPLGAENADVTVFKERPTNQRRVAKSFSLSGISTRLQPPPKMKHSESNYEDVTKMALKKLEEEEMLEYSVGADEREQAKERVDGETMINLVTLEYSTAEAYQLSNRSILVRPELLCDWGCETPRFHYDKFLGKKYRYFYAISSDVDAENPGTLVKVDVETKTIEKWCEPNCYPSEPVFVAAP
ncbi:PREDICTED: carotenoid isomerooxygenase-like, partial [Rhagoletis zephyria]|uniref:carotenoid isomerooxygenase-like n=1 Tax=Rhagoletis zephyria TaxID=28612 RepID=UPI000811A45A